MRSVPRSFVQLAAHTVAAFSEATHARKLPNARRYVSNSARDIGAPWPGTASRNGVAQTSSRAPCHRAGHAVSKKGAGKVTRSPITATLVASSYNQRSAVVTAFVATRRESGCPAILIVLDRSTGTS